MAPEQGQKKCKFEEEIQEAVKAMREGKVKSAYEAEKVFGIPRSTLTRRLKGTTQSRHNAHEPEQLLTDPEEEVLEDRCQHLTRAGYPARHSILREMCEDI
jgi:ABC-type methionine transport system ATPase subunit